MLRIIKKAALSVLIFNIIIVYASPVYAALYTPKQRFGVNTYICSRMDRLDIDRLEKQVGVGWQMNWNLSQWEKYGATYSIEHTPLVGVWSPYNHFNSYAKFRTAVMNELAESPDSFPDGTTWIIGNEIGYTPDYEFYEPAEYVDRFDQYYGYITTLGQQLNRHFKFATGSVFPLANFHYGNRTGNQYIRQVLEIYAARHGRKMPADAFTIDPYNFPPYSPTDFNQLKKQVTSFRQVLTDMGYRDKEVWIKEWGNLWHDGYPETSVQDGADYLDKSVNWFMTATSDTIGMPSDDNRLVQRWSWFYYNDLDRAWSCEVPSGGTYAKMYNSSTNQLNAIGLKYKELIQKYVGSLPTPTPTPTSTPTSIPTPTSPPNTTPTPTPTPTVPTPTINLACICRTNDTCSNSCTFSKFPAPITYTNPIKCNLASILFPTTPTSANKTSWCQATKRTKGDADGNNVINNADYFYYVAAVLGGKIPVTVNPDFNGDDEVGAADRTIIIKSLNP